MFRSDCLKVMWLNIIRIHSRWFGISKNISSDFHTSVRELEGESPSCSLRHCNFNSKSKVMWSRLCTLIKHKASPPEEELNTFFWRRVIEPQCRFRCGRGDKYFCPRRASNTHSAVANSWLYNHSVSWNPMGLYRACCTFHIRVKQSLYRPRGLQQFRAP